jgi:hypothetical protein
MLVNRESAHFSQCARTYVSHTLTLVSEPPFPGEPALGLILDLFEFFILLPPLNKPALSFLAPV